MLWTAQIQPPNMAQSAAVRKGNGVYLTPDEASVVTTSLGGTVTSYHALTGIMEWDYTPTSVGGTSVGSHSGVTFVPNAAIPFMVYSVVDDETGSNPQR